MHGKLVVVAFILLAFMILLLRGLSLCSTTFVFLLCLCVIAFWFIMFTDPKAPCFKYKKLFNLDSFLFIIFMVGEFVFASIWFAAVGDGSFPRDGESWLFECSACRIGVGAMKSVASNKCKQTATNLILEFWNKALKKSRKKIKAFCH